MVKVEISKKEAIFLGVFLFLVLLFGIVYAYNPNFLSRPGNPRIMGHTIDEVLLPDCSVGQAIVKKSDGWGCQYVSSSGSAVSLFGSCTFGDWIDLTDSATSGAVQGPVNSDGFVLAYTPSNAGGTYDIYGYTPSNVLRIRHKSGAVYREDPSQHITMPVRKGDTWKLEGTIEKVYWISINCSPYNFNQDNCYYLVTRNFLGNKTCSPGYYQAGVGGNGEDGRHNGIICCKF